jgi:hypothetical protein
MYMIDQGWWLVQVHRQHAGGQGQLSEIANLIFAMRRS